MCTRRSGLRSSLWSLLVVVAPGCSVAGGALDAAVPDAVVPDAPSAATLPASPRLVAGRLQATFSPREAAIEVAAHELSVAAVTMGRLGARTALGGSEPSVDGAEVHTERAGLSEWWRSTPRGLEHGLTLHERPPGGGPLLIEVAVAGDLTAHAVTDDLIELVEPETGAPVAAYSHLVVLDADGEPVAASMSVSGGAIVLQIDDAGADYPIVVDPLLTATPTTLTAPTGAASGFGRSVALAGDGRRAVIATSRNAYVFADDGTAWRLEATLLSAADEGTLGQVAIDAAGDVALVGIPSAAVVHVYVRTAGRWTRSAVLSHPEAGVDSGFGRAVALSGVGDRVIVGAPDADRAVIFARGAGGWSEEYFAGHLLAIAFGASVALSPDGARALIGAPLAGGGGGAELLVREGTGWRSTTAFSPATSEITQMGQSVALTATHALIGAPGRTPAALLYDLERGISVWLFEAPDFPLTFEERFGGSVALAAGSDRALIGSPSITGMVPDAAHVEVRGPTGWVLGTSLAPPSATPVSFGWSVALSSDGTRGLVGAPRDRSGAGSVLVYAFGTAVSAGSACTADAECASGFCTDGVCCDTRCEGECRACAAALTGGADGVCGALSAAVASATVCRPAAGACDAVETCSAASTTCPSDRRAATGTVCRPAVGACDVAETCSGALTCPADRFASVTTACGAAPAGPCDAADHCAGSSATCVESFLEGVVCRASTSACDAVERCAGSSVECPADVSCAPPDTSAVDAGRDAGDPPDAGVGDDVGAVDGDVGAPDAGVDGGALERDAGAAAPEASASCRGAPRRGSASWPLVLFVAALWLAPRSRARVGT